MNILFIAHRIPYPPDKGDKIRTFNIMKFLSKKHRVCLVSLYDDRHDEKYRDRLREFCKENHIFYINRFLAKLRALFYVLTKRSGTAGYFYSGRMASKIVELIQSESFDLIFVCEAAMAQYVINTDKKKIIDFMDCDSSKWSQYSKTSSPMLAWIYARHAEASREYEKKVIEKFDRCIVVSNFEKQEFDKFAETGKFLVIQNGVEAVIPGPAEAVHSDRIIFSGTMDYLVSVDAMAYFCKEIFPLVRERIPETEFYIVGRNPVKAVRSLQKIKGVFVTGSVDDAGKYLKSASIFVAPLRVGQGIQNKVLVAMSYGLPVVASPKALLGIDARIGRDVLTAKTPEDFAEEIVALLKDEKTRKTIGENGRIYVEKNHDWEKNLSILDKILFEPNRKA